MINYLDESTWKAVLEKPKNLPVKAQKTGVSEKLRAYKVANVAYERAKDEATADKLVSAIIDLKRTLDKEVKAHKTFKEATDHLRLVSKAADKRIQELATQKELIAKVKKWNEVKAMVGSL